MAGRLTAERQSSDTEGARRARMRKVRKQLADAGIKDEQALVHMDLQLSAREVETFAYNFYRGLGPVGMARKLAKGDPYMERYLRRRFLGAAEAPNVQSAVARILRAQLLSGLGPAVEALKRRAAEGNVHAIRLIFEASGFHNPRIQHEHSGAVEIQLSLPRPDRVVDSTATELTA